MPAYEPQRAWRAQRTQRREHAPPLRSLCTRCVPYGSHAAAIIEAVSPKASSRPGALSPQKSSRAAGPLASRRERIATDPPSRVGWWWGPGPFVKGGSRPDSKGLPLLPAVRAVGPRQRSRSPTLPVRSADRLAPASKEEKCAGIATVNRSTHRPRRTESRTTLYRQRQLALRFSVRRPSVVPFFPWSQRLHPCLGRRRGFGESGRPADAELRAFAAPF